MTPRTATYLDAIAHLPPGGTLSVPDVTWEEYEDLLKDLEESGWKLRVSYDHGELIIMSPSARHERYRDLILHIASRVAEKMNVVIESLGATTFRHQARRQGVEPDTCFYVKNAARIIGRPDIDLRSDPPPDVVVEIDITRQSARKLPIYAGLGVTEIWHYDERRLRILHLIEGQWTEASASRAFPLLTADLLTRLLEQSKTQGQSAALASLRDWLRAQ